MKPKRHHFIPKTYLKSFCDDEGMIWVYRKDNPTLPFQQRPDKLGFHKKYYSQPLPDGGMEHIFLEDFFSKLETKWTPIVEVLRRRESIGKEMIENIFQFIILQYARVPAKRDAVEKMKAARIHRLAKESNVMGLLPPPPKELVGKLGENYMDHLQALVDPHLSIREMPNSFHEAGKIMDRIGLNVIHNHTDVPFLTRDNPVIWFDPGVPETKMRPYDIQPDAEIRFLFPVAPNLIILGSCSWLEEFVRKGMKHRDCGKGEFVDECNRFICRFAYEAVLAQEQGNEALIQEYADVSPVLDTTEIPYKRVFGKREEKPKWKPHQE